MMVTVPSNKKHMVLVSLEITLSPWMVCLLSLDSLIFFCIVKYLRQNTKTRVYDESKEDQQNHNETTTNENTH